MPERLLIKNGFVITMDPLLGDVLGDVLIEGDRVAAVGANLTAEGATEIDARGKIVIPGLLDTHMHSWQAPLRGAYAHGWGNADYYENVFNLRESFTAKDMYDATFAAGVEMIDAGVTTVLNFCHNTMSPEHADESIRAHRDNGQRALFAMGMLGSFDELSVDHQWRLDKVRSLHAELGGDPSSLLRLGMAVSSMEFRPIEQVEAEVALARELGLRMTFHQNTGGQIRELHRLGLLGGDLLPAHANVAADDELELLADCGGGISFTPEGEFVGGRSMTVIGRALKAGATPSLGVDTAARTKVDIFGQMRITFTIMRYLQAQEEREADRWPLVRRPGAPQVEPRKMLEFATVNAAQHVGLGDQLGRLAPGYLADLVIVDPGPYGMALGDPANHVVLRTAPADVDTVVIGGVVRKQDGRLTDLDAGDAGAAIQRVRTRVLGEEHPAMPPHLRKVPAA
ncbi:amidohydrolase family protein [Sinosporangium siamense]|uniref:Cytosine deaminase n=1 Tax=Sinosporangium siamense TaxID=1367973 RepID=A0A919RLX5_9ACTN|nr:amidohydrolase family protein [Sinosporangium siamense]GII95993.1 cytosine deaminase [Sinosporangium siamense]